MRVASYFVLSLALHAAALAYPVSFGRRSQADLMHVTVLPMEPESLGAGGQGTRRGPAPRAGAKSAARTPPNAPREVETKPATDPQPQVLAAEAPAKVSDSSVALITAIANSAETHLSPIPGSASNTAYGSGENSDAIGTGGNGSGPSGAGSGSAGGLGSSSTGPGSGNGQGSSGNGIVLSQARYRDTPRPDYPESARRAGREGRVLLRVLVDDQGRTKIVEINSSSGSDVLDRAAAEAIRRWRFHPARHGDQPVESWLRIPIEFRLADAKP